MSPRTEKARRFFTAIVEFAETGLGTAAIASVLGSAILAFAGLAYGLANARIERVEKRATDLEEKVRLRAELVDARDAAQDRAILGLRINAWISCEAARRANPGVFVEPCDRPVP